MKVLISGATGLIGGALAKALRARGDSVVTLTRHPERAEPPAVGWDPLAKRLDPEALRGVDAAVHLAGESIASGRWTEAQKHRIRESRVAGTSLLAETLAGLDSGPRVLISASAIGYYGDRGEAPLDEEAGPGSTFLAEVCVAWERAAEAARQAGLRVVHPRIGVVLAKEGGALAKMLPAFKLGLGGKIGSGRQYMSWIALEDVVGLLLHALDRKDLAGPLNSTAPEPVTNERFTQRLGSVLSRPTLVPLPGFAAKLVLGQMADELLLASARVVPAKAVATDYQFRRPDLEDALRAVLDS